VHPGRLQSQFQGVQGHVDHLQPLRDALVLQPPSPGFRVSVRVGFPLNFLEETRSRESDNKRIPTHNHSPAVSTSRRLSHPLSAYHASLCHSRRRPSTILHPLSLRFPLDSNREIAPGGASSSSPVSASGTTPR
jgi:hypothetical protein